jgi:CheY-like chemotaxis protein
MNRGNPAMGPLCGTEEPMTITPAIRRVLLVDDDPDFIEKTSTILKGLADVRVVSEADGALALNKSWRPDLIMLDALFGSGDSFALLDALRESRPGERFGIVCLARGRGSENHIEPFGDELFGMIRREPDEERLRDEVTHAVRLTDRLIDPAA